MSCFPIIPYNCYTSWVLECVQVELEQEQMHEVFADPLNRREIYHWIWRKQVFRHQLKTNHSVSTKSVSLKSHRIKRLIEWTFKTVKKKMKYSYFVTDSL